MPMINHSPLVSIVVPVYNVEAYVAVCIESLLRQTYRNIQIILVDDGSTDKSGTICDSYAQKDDRVVVIHQKNGGLSAARNSGIAVASGDWIAVVDGDDYVHPQYIEDMLSAALHNNCEMAICHFKKVSDKDSAIYPYTHTSCSVLTKEHVLATWHGQRKYIETMAWNKLYKRILFEGIEYPIGKIHEDVFTTHRLVDRASNIAILSQPLYFYVQRGNSIIQSKVSIKRVQHSIEAQLLRLSFFAQNHYTLAVRKLRCGLVKYLLYYPYALLINSDIAWREKKATIKYLYKLLGQIMIGKLPYKDN